MELIAARTTSAIKGLDGRRPRFARIEMDEWRMFCGKSERTVAGALAQLERWHCVIREYPEAKTHRGGYSLNASAFSERPLPMPRLHRPRTRPHDASTFAPPGIAAARAGSAAERIPEAADDGQTKSEQVLQVSAEQEPAIRPSEPGPSQTAEATSVVQIVTPIRGDSQVKAPSDAPLAETFCPWGWTCPYILRTEAESGPVSQSVEWTDRPTEPGAAELEAIRAAIPAELCDQLNESPTVALLARIHLALGGAPPARLQQRIYSRWKAITSLGLIEKLASDVGEVWKQNSSRQAVADAQASKARIVDDCIMARQLVQEDSSDADDRAWASDTLLHALETDALDEQQKDRCRALLRQLAEDTGADRKSQSPRADL
jgi:hypothetical protein